MGIGDSFTKIDEYRWQPEANAFISERIRRVAEVINDYDASLFIAPIPDQLRAEEPDKSYALIHENPDGKVYCVRKLRDDEVNEGLVAWLFKHDNMRTNVLADLEAAEAARHALELKAKMEETEENIAIGQSILASPKHTYKHNGKVYQ